MTMDSWVAVTTMAGFGLTILAALRQTYRSLESNLGARIDRIEGRIDRLEDTLTTRIDRLEGKVDVIDRKHDQRFDTLSGQVYELNTRVTAALGLPRAADG